MPAANPSYDHPNRATERRSAPALLLDWLTRNGVTQRELARRIAVRAATVSTWVNETAQPRPMHMQQMADITGGEVPILAWFLIPRE